MARMEAPARTPPDLVVYGHDDERRVLSAVTAIGGRRENSIAGASRPRFSRSRDLVTQFTARSARRC